MDNFGEFGLFLIHFLNSDSEFEHFISYTHTSLSLVVREEHGNRNSSE